MLCRCGGAVPVTDFRYIDMAEAVSLSSNKRRGAPLSGKLVLFGTV